MMQQLFGLIIPIWLLLILVFLVPDYDKDSP
jgi:hypothetical protein